MASLGPVPVPAKLEFLLPYAKVAVAVAAVVATVLVMTLASPPAFVYLVISAASALGVFTVPNSNIKALLQDGQVVVSDTEAALEAARAGNAVNARSDVTQAMSAVSAAVTQADAIVKDVKAA